MSSGLGVAISSPYHCIDTPNVTTSILVRGTATESHLSSGCVSSVRTTCEHAFAPMIVCTLLPRFQLTVAAGDRTELLKVPAALAPPPGEVQSVGEVSLAAEAFGVNPGMRMGEALARCPRLTLVPPDAAGVADIWERQLVRLESIGAAVEPERPGLVCFDARGLLRLHGGIEGILAAARRALGAPARYGVAPSRFVAVAAATQARVRRPAIV